MADVNEEEVKVELRQPRPRSYAGASGVSDGFNFPLEGLHVILRPLDRHISRRYDPF
jgi:hypothetical protein